MTLSAALSVGYAYYILLFILFSLAELYLMAQYYLLYLFINWMICIGIIICVILDGASTNYLMMTSPFAIFAAKVNDFFRKAICIDPKLHFDITDPSASMGPRRERYVNYQHDEPGHELRSHWSDYSTASERNPALGLYKLFRAQAAADSQFPTAGGSRQVDTTVAYGKLCNRNPFGIWGQESAPPSWFNTPAAPSPATTYHSLPSPATTYHSLPNTPYTQGHSNLSATCTTVYENVNDELF